MLLLVRRARLAAFTLGFLFGIMLAKEGLFRIRHEDDGKRTRQCAFRSKPTVVRHVDVGWKGGVYFAYQSCFCECVEHNMVICKECSTLAAQERLADDDGKDTSSTGTTTTTREPRVLCWIPSKEQDGPVIDIIRETWGRHCNLLVFTSTEANKAKNVAKIEGIVPGRSLWNIVHPGWAYVAEKYLDQYDWFMKLDDDSYFSTENFRHFVSRKGFDPINNHYYLGHTLTVMGTRKVFNLGAGHGVSQRTLRDLAPFLPTTKSSTKTEQERCERTDTWAEDVAFRDCLAVAGLQDSINSRDELGRDVFLAFPPNDNLITVRRPDSTSWFWSGKSSRIKGGVWCCAPHPISWHGLKLKEHAAGKIYGLEYFVYGVAVDPLPRTILDDAGPDSPMMLLD